MKELSNEVRLTANQLTPVIQSVWADRASVWAEIRACEQEESVWAESESVRAERESVWAERESVGSKTPVIQAYNNHMLRLWIKWYTCPCDTYSIHMVRVTLRPCISKPTYIWQSEHRCTYDIRPPIPQAYVYLAYSTHKQVHEALSYILGLIGTHMHRFNLTLAI